jgi:hypothetical protein
MNAFQISSDVRLTETQDGAVLLDLKGGSYFSTNHVGFLVWRCLKEGCDQGEVARRVAENFSMSAEEVNTDVATFIEKLKAQKLLIAGDIHASPNSGWRRFLNLIFQ